MKSGIRSSRIRQAHSGASLTSILAIAALTTIWAIPAQAADDEPQAAAEAEQDQTGSIIVTGELDSDRAKAKLQKVPGAASLVLNKDVERGRASNAEDVLAFVPGVFAASTSGNQASKISIRGSGLNTFYQGYSLGIRYLYDGMPITGPGGTQEDLLNIAAVNYTEILNGSNAFDYGAVSLGGAINFLTHTGYSSPGLFASAEFGSFGHRKFQASYGGTTGNGDTDYYVSFLRDQRDGYQRNAWNKGEDFILNVGHKFSDRFETRFIARHRWQHLFNGSTLTLDQIKNDPQLNLGGGGRKKKGTTLLVSKSAYTFDDNSVAELGIAYNNYPLWNGWGGVAPQSWRSKDLSTSIRYLRTGDQLFSIPVDTTFAYTSTWLIFGDVTGYDVRNGNRDFRVFTKYTGSHDSTYAISNDFHLDANTTLSTGLSLIDIERNIRIIRDVRTNTSTFPTAVHYSDRTFAPKVGLLHQANEKLQLFGNVTRSVDPPVTWQMGSTGNPYIRPLKPQKAWTVEAGGRARTSALEGSLTVYRTWVKDELLTIVIIPGSATTEAITANSNASPTIHQGIEAGLSWKIWQGDEGNLLTFRQSYTLNDFHYRNDSDFGKNDLPGLPRHFYQGELLAEQNGFYAGLNVRVMSDYYVDYANSLKAPSVTIWGAKLGWQPSQLPWKLFLDLRNLTNKRYATATNTAFDLKGVDSRNFYVGDKFSVFGGISFRL